LRRSVHRFFPPLPCKQGRCVGRHLKSHRRCTGTSQAWALSSSSTPAWTHRQNRYPHAPSQGIACCATDLTCSQDSWPLREAAQLLFCDHINIDWRKSGCRFHPDDRVNSLAGPPFLGMRGSRGSAAQAGRVGSMAGMAEPARPPRPAFSGRQSSKPFATQRS